MAEWRSGTKTGRTLWRDEVLVGMVDSPEIAAEIAAEIVEGLNLLDEVRPIDRSRQRAAESGRERSLTCSCPRIDVGSTYHEYVLGPRDEDCPFHGKPEAAEPVRQSAGGRVCGCRDCRSKRGEYLP
jgi:hypothetical protein